MLNQKPQYRDALGSIVAGGSLVFYESETTTPKSVFGGPDGSPDLGSTLTLSAAGRTSVDPWLIGDYTVELLDADDVQVWSLDNVRDFQAATAYALPNPASGTDGQVVTTDGAIYQLSTILGLPDPTGFANGYLATDGATWFPAVFPAATTYDEDNLPGGLDDSVASVIDFGTQRIIKGTGTCPTSGTTASTVAITFPLAFGSTPVVVVTATVGPVTSESARCSMQALGANTTQFTASAFAGAEDGGGALNISTAVTFNYIAWGDKP